MLDLRHDAVIIDVPAYDSEYVSLMVTGYDHYVNVAMARETKTSGSLSGFYSTQPERKITTVIR